MRCLAGGDFGGIRLQFVDVFLCGLFPRLWQTAGHAARELRGQFRVRFLVSGEFFIPALLRFLAFFAGVPGAINLFRDLKCRVVPAEFLPRQRHFFFAQRCAVRFLFPCFIW